MKNVSRRALEFGITFFLAISINFFLPRMVPGDPIKLIAGNAAPQLGKERIEALRAQYGLDKPLPEQYIIYLKQLARGDLGQSYRFSGGKSVVEVLSENFRWTLLLVGVSLTLALLIGSALGIWSATQRGDPVDLGLLTGVYMLRSIPPFWLAMLLIPIFAIQLRYLPAGDSYSIPRLEGWENIKDVARHALMPVTVLTLAYLPTAFVIMRAAMSGILEADFIRTARAKGLSNFWVVMKHGARNALLPVLTSFMVDLGQLLGGVTVIEAVFNYRGIGNMMFEAVKSRDYPLLQGGFLLFTITILLLNIITELLYPYLDPRLRRTTA
ncbi:MAG TPA: ABC transporter permease [Anaerolineales bacterium]|nr:ABC transporter permease [Anaerolineales bacterium]